MYFLFYTSNDFHELAYEQGAGKTTLLKAILNKRKPSTSTFEAVISKDDVQEGIVDGLCYCDSPGINMQVFSFRPWFFLFSFCASLQSVLCSINLVLKCY